MNRCGACCVHSHMPDMQSCIEVWLHPHSGLYWSGRAPLSCGVGAGSPQPGNPYGRQQQQYPQGGGFLGGDVRRSTAAPFGSGAAASALQQQQQVDDFKLRILEQSQRKSVRVQQYDRIVSMDAADGGQRVRAVLCCRAPGACASRTRRPAHDTSWLSCCTLP